MLIRGARIWDGDGFRDGDVLVRDGKLAAIGQGIDLPGDWVYDAAGCILTPGLVDIHTHLRGVSIDRYGTQAELAAIPFGVTAAVDAGAEQGSAALLDAMLIDTAVFICAKIVDNRADFSQAEVMAARYGDRVVGIKVYFDTTGAPVRDITPLREICCYAASRGWRVMVHCAHSPVPMAEILETLRPGDILTHAYHGGVHTTADDGFASLRAAKARGVIIDAGLAGHVHTDFGVLTSALAQDATPDTISSDITCVSAYTRGGRYGLTLCMSIFRALGMPEDEIFRAVTTRAAHAVGRADEWGRLAVGRAADLALIEEADGAGFSLTDKAGHHIESGRGYRYRLTVVGGKVAYQF